LELADNLVEFNGEGIQDPSQRDVVQTGRIGGCVDDVGEDVIVEGILAECEEHEVTPSLVVGREGSRMIMITYRMLWMSAA
jgi:hypothetical protein